MNEEDNGDGSREQGIEIQSRSVTRRMRWWQGEKDASPNTVGEGKLSQKVFL